jgi:hypothetical protein
MANMSPESSNGRYAIETKDLNLFYGDFRQLKMPV